MYYLYRHIRLDKKEVFYIGIGTIVKTNYNTQSLKTLYTRAYKKGMYRNQHWNNIVNKTDYIVEIMYHTENILEIQEKEREFIALYKDTLTNLTKGGHGIESFNHKEKTKQQISNSMLGVKKSKEHISNMNKRKYKKIIMYNDNEKYSFNSVTEAVKYLGKTNITNISACLKGKRKKAFGYKYIYNEVVESEDKEPQR